MNFRKWLVKEEEYYLRPRTVTPGTIHMTTGFRGLGPYAEPVGMAVGGIGSAMHNAISRSLQKTGAEPAMFSVWSSPHGVRQYDNYYLYDIKAPVEQLMRANSNKLDEKYAKQQAINHAVNSPEVKELIDSNTIDVRWISVSAFRQVGDMVYIRLRLPKADKYAGDGAERDPQIDGQKFVGNMDI